MRQRKRKIFLECLTQSTSTHIFVSWITFYFFSLQCKSSPFSVFSHWPYFGKLHFPVFIMRCIFLFLPVTCCQTATRTLASFNESCGFQSTLSAMGDTAARGITSSLSLFKGNLYFYQAFSSYGFFHTCPGRAGIHMKDSLSYYYYFNSLEASSAFLFIP